MRFAGLVVIVTAIVGLGAPAEAVEYRVGPSDYQAMIPTLQPGDIMHLAPGVYVNCMVIEGVHGTAAQPITITGPETGPTAVFTADRCVHPSLRYRSASVKIRDSSYVVVRHLELDGQGRLVDGVEADYDPRPSHHITIEFLHLHSHNGDGGVNAISTKAPVWDWVIRFNVIEEAGIGMYLGDSNGAAQFMRGVVEHNLVINPFGYAMQIKHQNARPMLAGMPMGDNVTLVRHNVFIKSEASGIGNLARPTALFGHWPLSGPGQNDRYEIYGNLFFENASQTEFLLQGEGNIALHDNLFVNTFGAPAISMQPHNDVPKSIAIYRNTVLAQGRGIRIAGADANSTQLVVGNAVFSSDPLVGGQRIDNFTAPFAMAAVYVNDATPALGSLDLYPKAGQLMGAVLDTSPFTGHADLDLDFNKAMRSGVYRGAYGGSGTNPGWRPWSQIKPTDPIIPPPPDAGVGDTGVVDTGVVDTGFEDAGVEDAGFAKDAAAPDAVVPIDAGFALDAVVGVDAGFADDAVVVVPDSGTARDAQSAPRDAFVIGVDAFDPPRRAVDGGFGCAATHGSRDGSWLLALFSLVLGRGRRRR